MIKKLEPRKCAWCGKTFEPYKGDQTFCCRACSQASRSANTTTKVCRICGKEFEAVNEVTKYCSDRCRNTYARIRYELESDINDKAISLIRYGQQNPFTRPAALWGVYQEEYKGKFEDDDNDNDN